MSMAILRWYLPDANFRRAATHQLQKHFPDKSEQVWRSTRDWQSRLAPSRPRYGFSLNFLMRYMEWSLSLYRAVQEHGMSQVEAGEFVETVAVEYFQPVPTAMFKLSRLRSAKRETRVRWLFGIITRAFFTPPFVHRHLPSDTGVAFDVTVCPLAAYFKDQRVPELTEYAACNPDSCLERAFGIKLIRSQTIAKGAEYCDFRWKFLTHRERTGKAEQ